MNFFKDKKRFDFLYGGKQFWECDYTETFTETDDTLTAVYTLPDGL